MGSGRRASLAGKAYFAGSNPSRGKELWASDGTKEDGSPQGTFPAPGVSRPANLIRAGSRLFFSAHHPDTGTELWALEVPSLFPGS